jgi:hypothetical protein
MNGFLFCFRVRDIENNVHANFELCTALHIYFALFVGSILRFLRPPFPTTWPPNRTQKTLTAPERLQHYAKKAYLFHPERHPSDPRLISIDSSCILGPCRHRWIKNFFVWHSSVDSVPYLNVAFKGCYWRHQRRVLHTPVTWFPEPKYLIQVLSIFASKNPSKFSHIPFELPQVSWLKMHGCAYQKQLQEFLRVQAPDAQTLRVQAPDAQVLRVRSTKLWHSSAKRARLNCTPLSRPHRQTAFPTGKLWKMGFPPANCFPTGKLCWLAKPKPSLQVRLNLQADF